MKISILGTNGFLSNAIGHYANEQNWQLDMYGLDKPSTLHYENFYPINLMDKDLNCTTMLDSDIIIYAIGAGIQSNLNEGVDLIYSLNLTSPIMICNKLRFLNYQGVFVTFGSYFELGETSLQVPATEEVLIKSEAPVVNDYAVSKRLLTRYVTSYQHDFKHWHFILPTIYGPGENPKRLIPYTINALRQEEELHFTSGEQIRQYLYVGDVAAILKKAWENSLSSGIYNIAGPETLTVREIVELIHAYFNKEVPTQCFGNAARADVRMKYLALNGLSLEDMINEKASSKLQDIIKLYIDGITR